MRYFYIDSCALVKRYHKEKGTDQVDVLFDTLIGRKPKCLITSIISINLSLFSFLLESFIISGFGELLYY